MDVQVLYRGAGWITNELFDTEVSAQLSTRFGRVRCTMPCTYHASNPLGIPDGLARCVAAAASAEPCMLPEDPVLRLPRVRCWCANGLLTSVKLVMRTCDKLQVMAHFCFVADMELGQLEFYFKDKLVKKAAYGKTLAQLGIKAGATIEATPAPQKPMWVVVPNDYAGGFGYEDY